MSLRVTGGALRGRPLRCPPGETVRPTGARVREALFSILGQRLDGLVVLDLFAGTGALGIEAASRGAASVLFVESSSSHREDLRVNTTLIGDRATVIASDAFVELEHLGRSSAVFDLILVDPPYHQGLAQRALDSIGASASLLGPGARLVVETSRDEGLTAPPSLALDATRRYGDTSLHFFRRSP